MLCFACKDTENEAKLPLTQVSVDEILDLQRQEQMQRQHSEELKKKAMQERGLVVHSDPIQDDFFWLCCCYCIITGLLLNENIFTTPKTLKILHIFQSMVPTTVQNSFSLTFHDKVNRFPWLICSCKIPMSAYNHTRNIGDRTNLKVMIQIICKRSKQKKFWTVVCSLRKTVQNFFYISVNFFTLVLWFSLTFPDFPWL